MALEPHSSQHLSQLEWKEYAPEIIRAVLDAYCGRVLDRTCRGHLLAEGFGLICDVGDQTEPHFFTTTDAGLVYVRALFAVPRPIQQWVIPCSES
jgi:hypothetical protein